VRSWRLARPVPEGASKPRARARSTASTRRWGPSLAYRLRMWVLTVFGETRSSRGDFRRVQVGRQVAQHADLAAAERLGHWPRPGRRRPPAGSLRACCGSWRAGTRARCGAWCGDRAGPGEGTTGTGSGHCQARPGRARVRGLLIAERVLGGGLQHARDDEPESQIVRGGAVQDQGELGGGGAGYSSRASTPQRRCGSRRARGPDRRARPGSAWRSVWRTRV
jgi:hypothetical protein